MAKIKVGRPTRASLAVTKQYQIAKAKSIYAARPFVTKLWMMMQGFPQDFINDNWKEITGEK